MGIFSKFANWIRGKGFKETEEVEPTEKIQPKQEELLKTEDQITQEREEAEQEIQQQEEEKQYKITTKTPTIPIKTTTKPDSDIQKAIKQIRSTGSITKVQENLRGGGIRTISFEPTQNLNGLRQKYEDLLQGGNVGIDQAMMEVIIENREKLVHRFSARITITTDQGRVTMDVDGILLENTNDIYQFIQKGQTYTSEELKRQMYSLRDHYEKQYGAIGGEPIIPPSKVYKIQDIDVQQSFA